MNKLPEHHSKVCLDSLRDRYGMVRVDRKMGGRKTETSDSNSLDD